MILFLVVASLAVARSVRLIVDDTLLDVPRDWLLPKLGKYPKKLLTCPWCLSAWISAGVTGWFWAAHTLAMPLLSWGACWWGACAGYWFTEVLAGWHEGPPDPTAEETVADFWRTRAMDNEALPDRPPLPKRKRRNR